MTTTHVGNDLTDISTSLYGGFSDLQLQTVQDQFSKQNIDLNGSSFTDYTTSIYAKYASDAAINHAKVLTYQSTSITNPNAILAVGVDELANVNPLMGRYVMSHPDLYDMYENQEIQGYDTYLKMCDVPVEITPEYVAVTNGMSTTGDYGIEQGVFTSISEPMGELEMFDRYNVLHSWDNVNMALANGDDPTVR